jgi:peptide deformylase
MALLPIITAPDPRLKLVSQPVERVDDATRKLMDDMLETMYAAPGIGLAAVQVGVPKRIIVIDLQPKTGETDTGEPIRGREPRFFINPEIVWASEEMAVYEEGCLSVPEHYADVERPAQVKIRHLGYDGREQILEADGMLATCVQHEIDHLEGVLFVDHLSAVKRGMILRKLQKARKQKLAAVE